uniref:Ankyrin repeat protein n=1 Tax=Florenciella sp. virus SA2 TaxID=3240092 RepID=A0AB39J8N8_9VIRU
MNINLPKDLIITIVEFLVFPNIYNTSTEIKKNSFDNMVMYLIFKYDKFKKVFQKNVIIHRLTKKYYIYHYDYNIYLDKYQPNMCNLFKKYYKNQSSPLLIDVLFTGCNLPFARHSANPTEEYFETEMFQDIQSIIKHVPSSIDSTWGQLRCRTGVTPLYAAIINEKIPIYIIKYLLDNGAYKNTNIYVNNERCDVLSDYYFCNVEQDDGNSKEFSKKRYLQIKQLLNKYK